MMTTYEPSRWRLIIDEEPRSGAANMALDQAVAEACAAGACPPTVRFYRWHPPAVSLGRHQAASEVDMEAALEQGYEVVRRPTGGRAILHTDELTYSIAAAADEPRVEGSIMDAYLRLSNALLAGLRSLGLEADKAPGDVRAGPDVSAACFEVPSAYEITAGGRKLLGSAQSRRAGYVLQHGSLPLAGDVARLADVLSMPDPDRAALRAQLSGRATTLAEALGVPEDSERVQFANVAQALSQGFAQTLNVTLSKGQFTPAEVRRAAVLIRETFANPEWTHRR